MPAWPAEEQQTATTEKEHGTHHVDNTYWSLYSNT